MRPRTIGPACRLAFLCLLLAEVSAAQAPDPPAKTAPRPPEAAAEPRNGARTLGGHTFLLPTGGEGPFITTHFGIAQGVYYLRVPNFPINGFVAPFDVVVSGLTETATFALAATEWLGFAIRGKGIAITGTDDISLVTRGALLDFGGGASVAARVFALSSTQFTVRAAVDYSAGYEMDFKQLAQIVEAGKQIFARTLDMKRTTAELSRMLNEAPRTSFAPTSALGYRFGAHFAQAAGRAIGFQGVATFTLSRETLEPFDFVKQRSERITFNRRTLQAGASGEADLRHAGAPIAFELGYSLAYVDKDDGAPEQPLKPPEGVTHTAGAGIFYSGAHHFQLGVRGAATLGLEGHRGIATDRLSGSPMLLVGLLELYYVW